MRMIFMPQLCHCCITFCWYNIDTRLVIATMNIFMSDIVQDEASKMEALVKDEWERVVIYFLLRTTLAPCIETLILLDRQLFLEEKGKKSLVEQHN